MKKDSVAFINVLPELAPFRVSFSNATDIPEKAMVSKDIKAAEFFILHDSLLTIDCVMQLNFDCKSYLYNRFNCINYSTNSQGQ